MDINDLLYRLFKKQIWFRAEHIGGHLYTETNILTLKTLLPYIRNPFYTYRFWID